MYVLLEIVSKFAIVYWLQFLFSDNLSIQIWICNSLA